MIVGLGKFHIDNVGRLLEPATPLTEPTDDDVWKFDPQISIAISLKRIADTLDFNAGTFAVIADAMKPTDKGEPVAKMTWLENVLAAIAMPGAPK